MDELFCDSVMNIMINGKINKKCELVYNKEAFLKTMIKQLEKNNIDIKGIENIYLKKTYSNNIAISFDNFLIDEYIWCCANNIELMKILEKKYCNILYVEEIVYIFNVISGIMQFMSMMFYKENRKYCKTYRKQFVSYLKYIKKTICENNNLKIDIEKFKNSFYQQTAQGDTEIASIEHIIYGKTYNNEKIIYGLIVKDTNFLISDLIKDMIDNYEIYKILKKDEMYANISFSIFNTIFKITYLVLRELEVHCDIDQNNIKQ